MNILLTCLDLIAGLILCFTSFCLFWHLLKKRKKTPFERLRDELKRSAKARQDIEKRAKKSYKQWGKEVMDSYID